MQLIAMQHDSAFELQISEWLNTDHSIRLSDLRGRVVVLHAFQMLCPGCVSHGIPQATRVFNTFHKDEVAVIGLHTVFEHHDVMTAAALRAFIHEYRLPFPIGIDQSVPGQAVPLTMQLLALRGTPTVILIDKQGGIRLHKFGVIGDMQLGASIGQLILESSDPANLGSQSETKLDTKMSSHCSESACGID